MPGQHADLSPERWAGFSLDQQILMIANEMNRAGKLLGGDNLHRRRNSYARVLRLVDLTVQVRSRPTLRRELLRWRDLIGMLYLGASGDPAAHRAAFRCLLRFTPVVSQQLRHLQTPQEADHRDQVDC